MSLRRSWHCFLGTVTVIGAVIGLYARTGLWACGGYGEADLRSTDVLVAQLGEMAGEASSVEPSDDAQPLIEELRERGPVALDQLIAYRDAGAGRSVDLVAAKTTDSSAGERLDRMIDLVAGQRGATRSRLYWYTSLSMAKEAAQRRGRPILSLRMLGRLDEELSCANSRFFRTLLYPDPTIAKRLRDDFVLHWEPVRSVPVVTIDYGDGRQLRRTLTGNSVHLVLSSKGEPIDALPGLVSPAQFVKWLNAASHLHRQLGNDVESHWAKVTDHHHARAIERRQNTPMTIRPDQSVGQLNPLDRRWQEVAELYRPVAISGESRRTIEQQMPNAEDAMPTTVMKAFVETPVLRMVRRVETDVARDTAFNLHGLQPKIDDWFVATGVGGQSGPLSYESLTQRIYAEVFLMPLDDPWLGLSPDDQLTALDGAGRVSPSDDAS